MISKIRLHRCPGRGRPGAGALSKPATGDQPRASAGAMTGRGRSASRSPSRPRRDDRLHDRDGEWRRPHRVERRRRSASQSSDDEFGRARGGDSAAAGGGGASSDRRRGRRYRDRSRSRDRDRDRRVRRRSRSRTLSPPRVHRDDLARHPRDARPRSRDRARSRDASRDRRGVARSSPIEHRASGPPHHLQPRRSYGRTADIPRPVRRGLVPSAPTMNPPSSTQPLTSPASPAPDGSTRPQGRGRRRRREPGLGRPGTPRVGARTPPPPKVSAARSSTSSPLCSRTRPNSARDTPR